ncbi:hypothetical protein MTO96_031798 [Rhipicephalus appendiculatus]
MENYMKERRDRARSSEVQIGHGVRLSHGSTDRGAGISQPRRTCVRGVSFPGPRVREDVSTRGSSSGRHAGLFPRDRVERK